MAIIECVPGIEVTVVSGGNTIKEYVDEETEDESNKVTRYIKAISGQNFEVHIKVAKDFEVKGDDLAFRIYMDGRWVAGPLISKKTISEGCGRRVSQGRQSDGSKYCFSTLETVSDGTYVLAELSRIKALGQIEITVADERKVEKITTLDTKPSSSKSEPQSHGIVSEKLLKGQAISHSISFTPSQHGSVLSSSSSSLTTSSASTDITWKTVLTDPSKPSLARFVFKYRSLDALKAMLIIPRTPSPEPEIPLEERDFDTLTPEEQREVFKRMQTERTAQQEMLKKIKREQNDNDSPRARKIARPQAGDTLLELDETGGFSQASTDTLGRDEKEVIDLD